MLRNFARNSWIYIYLMIIVLSGTFVAGCSTYKMEIKQGIDLSAEKLDQLVPGLSKQQVYNILGTSTLAPINPNQLDYFYIYKNHNTNQYIKKHLILYFNNNGLLNHYEGDFNLKKLPTTKLQNQANNNENTTNSQ